MLVVAKNTASIPHEVTWSCDNWRTSKSKQFDNFSDANGFARGLIKKEYSVRMRRI